jgi:hypothetical protein
MGILVSRGRMMTNNFQLNACAKNWIKAIQSQYISTLVEDKRVIAEELSTNLMK